MPNFLLYVGSWLAVVGGFVTLFEKGGDILRPESRKSISQWLNQVAVPEPGWPTHFATLFDRVFTGKHLSLRCFVRSSGASLAAVGAITLLWLAIARDTGVFWESVPLSILLLALFNLVPDYLSLLETRYAIRIMTRWRSGGVHGLILLADLVASLGIFVILSYVGWNVLFTLANSAPPITPAAYLEMLREAVNIRDDNLMLSVPLYSTLFTSVWAWLFAGSGLAFKVLTRSNRVLAFFRRHLNIEEHPTRSIGLLAALAITFLYLVAAPFLL
jgi:hypothetical protein